jgi:hypothetical protein
MHSSAGSNGKRKRGDSDGDLKDDNVASDDGANGGIDSAGNQSNGSFSMDEIKSSSDYDRRITYLNAPKKRYALALAYLGTNYQGIHFNV